MKPEIEAMFREGKLQRYKAAQQKYIEDVKKARANTKHKKTVHTYICECCGRKKTVRFEKHPISAMYGVCPRCKEGSLISEIIINSMEE